MNKRLFALLALAVVSSVSYAAGDDAKQKEKFSKMKQVVVDGIQGRITILQTALS